jgi:Protein of unknown function (DUF2905)
MESIGRYFIIGGILLIILGGLVILAGKFGLHLGHLPGDIRIEGKNGVFYFPLATCILLSLILSGILTLVSRLWRK